MVFSFFYCRGLKYLSECCDDPYFTRPFFDCVAWNFKKPDETRWHGELEAGAGVPLLEI